jgi:hypothetical protein
LVGDSAVRPAHGPKNWVEYFGNIFIFGLLIRSLGLATEEHQKEIAGAQAAPVFF